MDFTAPCTETKGVFVKLYIGNTQLHMTTATRVQLFISMSFSCQYVMVAKQFRMRSIVAIVVGIVCWPCLSVCGKKPPAMNLFDIQHKTGFYFANADMKSKVQRKNTNDLISCAALCGKVSLQTKSSYSFNLLVLCFVQ